MSTLEIDKVKVKSEPEEFIAERVKLNALKKSKNIQDFDSKQQTINQTCNIISTIKS